VLGTESFLERVRQVVAGDEREQPGLKAIRVRITFDEVVRAVAKEKGEDWELFRDRRGDWGRDLTLFIARRHCGMTLQELGESAGGLRSVAVHMALRRMASRLQYDDVLRALYHRLTRSLECIV